MNSESEDAKMNYLEQFTYGEAHSWKSCTVGFKPTT
jgi:hypothetical protein